ncbi:hypothetical protein NBRC110019_20270 [Neptunitalea chrysea]|uniref:DUF2628 domain-containing protein n=1 Tax=Neptunitalea chrysea TaxID=1647581 RepID=A0A9W6EVV5_9FLAO|nr:DUF2628 domain-containing protein [Neptunitalea chrysea]GLB52987.1 hypothetical protein NBRC110019_20270 [Neptunitalea chrysea]
MLSDKERQLYQAYFKTEIPYYTKQLEKYDETGRCSFNFYALLFGMLWMAYRKMYREIAFYFLIFLCAEFLQKMATQFALIPADRSEMISLIVSLILGIVLGMYANQLYIAKCKREILGLIDLTDREEHLTNAVAAKGGIQPWAPVLLFFIIIVVQYLLVIAAATTG